MWASTPIEMRPPMRHLLAFILFLPLMTVNPVAARVPIVKGVALNQWSHMEDLAALNAPNFYGWGEYCGTRANCTNMVREWQLPATCYPTLLVGNEPTNPEPAGYPITATLAVSRTLAIAAMCPNTQLIVANIHVNNGNGFNDKEWIKAYYARYKLVTGKKYGSVAHTSGLYDLVGLHCYSQTASTCASKLSATINLPAYTGQFWITEWNVWGSATQFTAMLNWLVTQPRIDRSYVFTNRGFHPLIDLVMSDGTLTASGALYRDWTGQ